MTDTEVATGPAPSADGLAGWWGRVGPVKRVIVIVAGLVVGVNLTLVGLQSVTGGADPGGPTSSAHATARDGLAAYADLLEAEGRAVTRLGTPLAEATLSPGATLVVADPEPMTSADQAAVSNFVRRGGRLVAAGPEGATLASTVSGAAQGWTQEGSTLSRPPTALPSTVGVQRVVGAGFGALVAPGPALTLLEGTRGRATATLATAGRGTVVLVADSSILQNEWLGRADNATFAVGVTAGRPVVFAESVHGFGTSRGLAALPAPARRAGIALGLCALLAVWVFGQRFGPPERRHRALAPPRRGYVDSLAAAVARTRDIDGALEPVRASARRRLCVRTSLPATTPDPQLASAAVASGLPADEVGAILSPSGGDPAAAITLGRAAAHLRGAPR